MGSIAYTRAAILPAIAAAAEEQLGACAVRAAFLDQELPLRLLSDPTALIPLRDLLGVIGAIGRRAGDEHIGAFLGRRMNPEVYGTLVGYAGHGRTLGEALGRLVRALPLHQSGSEMALRVSGELAAWSYRIDAPLSSGRGDHAVLVLLQFLQLVRTIVGAAFRPLRVELETAKPRGLSLLEEIFAAPVSVGAAANSMIFDAALLARPIDGLARPAPVTLADMRRYVLARPPSTSSGAVEHVLRLAGACPPGLDGVARRLGLGPRTLQRRLAAEGLSFGDVLDRYRRRRAHELVRGTGLSLQEIGGQLGYRHPGDFTRAYRRWHSHPPSADRANGTI